MSKDPNVYRATFQFQKIRPDQIQMRIKAPTDIQIHQDTKDRWEAWYYHPTDRRVSQPLRNQDRHPITAGSLARCKELVREQFERVVTTWQAYDQAGKLVEAPPAAEAQQAS